MLKLAGHTMRTPKKSLFEAMGLFRDVGYDGIEVRVAVPEIVPARECGAGHI